MADGYLAIVLHAHLPYVRHPEYESFLEERWFFEAMTETYIPICKFCEKLHNENVPFKITISLSPTLLAMMEDPMLIDRYRDHLTKSIELSIKEQERHTHNGHLRWLAQMYHHIFIEALELFDRYEGHLARCFKKLHEAGCIELITCSATHGILPFLAAQPQSVFAQVKTGVDYFTSVFGFAPKGMWLPECAYAPGIDEALRKAGIRYFFTESNAIDHASVRPHFGVFGPLYTPSGVAAFGRDQGSTEEVWSAQKGYPGDGNYREFYRDIGFDSDYNYIKPYISGDIRVDTGIKYYRITGRTNNKEFYNPDWARERAAAHAGHFLSKRIGQIAHLHHVMKIQPIVIAPFDAELFGHWWFEGPQWLDFLIRKTVFDQKTITLTSPGDYLNDHPLHQSAVPCTSTWGKKSTFETWLNGKTHWIYPYLFECVNRLNTAARPYATATPPPLVKRALDQCAREILLAQSSDWPFIITGGTSEQYANRRVKDHVSRCYYLADAIKENTVDEEKLQVFETIDAIFPEIDYRLFLEND